MPPKRIQTPSSSSLSSGPAVLSSNSSVYQIAHHVWQQYLTTTPQRTMMLDAFMPFNAFLSGFCAAVGQFVLTASLRMQTSSELKGVNSKPSSKGKNARFAAVEGGEQQGAVSHERAFADYIFGSLILHFFCINFIN
ncbi:oligosaccharyltransferase complex subunit epsilon [Aspergillus fumigatus]